MKTALSKTIQKLPRFLNIEGKLGTVYCIQYCTVCSTVAVTRECLYRHNQQSWCRSFVSNIYSRVHVFGRSTCTLLIDLVIYWYSLCLCTYCWVCILQVFSLCVLSMVFSVYILQVFSWYISMYVYVSLHVVCATFCWYIYVYIL